MEPRKIKMLLHDDVLYQILLWLPVVSLFRFKCVCRSWHALIKSSHFIKKHLHLHHYDPSFKDKNHNLIYLLQVMDSPITFALTSIQSFEVLNVCQQLNRLELHGCFPVEVFKILSYNGIICLNLFNHERGQSVCLWNPATKQLRVLPRSQSSNMVETTVGFGFDVISNDYKVVNLINRGYPNEIRVEVYSLNTSFWRSVTTVIPFIKFLGNPSMPFNNGTCFFWLGYKFSENKVFFCFDFGSEMFRSIPFPRADYIPLLDHMSLVHDKIACVFIMKDHQLEIWTFNEYGRVNESWAKLYTIDPYSTIDRGACIQRLSMNGDYIFFERMEKLFRFNVATEETNICTLEFDEELFKNYSRYSPDIYWFINQALVEFKESLVSVGEGISAPTGINKDTGNKKQETITN